MRGGGGLRCATDRSDTDRLGAAGGSAILRIEPASPEISVELDTPSMRSTRAVGVRNQDTTAHLWLVPFYPARGASGRPFHLPGQPADVGANHGAELLPDGLPEP